MDVVEPDGAVRTALTTEPGRTPQMGGRKIRHFRDGLSGASCAVYLTPALGHGDGD